MDGDKQKKKNKKDIPRVGTQTGLGACNTWRLRLVVVAFASHAATSRL